MADIIFVIGMLYTLYNVRFLAEARFGADSQDPFFRHLSLNYVQPTLELITFTRIDCIQRHIFSFYEQVKRERPRRINIVINVKV